LNSQIKNVVDFGTGSGCISLYFAKHLKNSNIYSIDNNPKAIKLANKNKKQLKLKNIKFLEADLFSDLDCLKELEGNVDVIVSNPPYIPDTQRDSVDESVLLWEDEKALFSSNFGTSHIVRIIEISKKLLRPVPIDLNKPRMVIEIGGTEKQMEIIREVAKRNGFEIAFYRDSAQKYRYISMW